MNLGHLSLVFLHDLVQLSNAHFKACELLKLWRSTAGITRGRMGKIDQEIATSPRPQP